MKKIFTTKLRIALAVVLLIIIAIVFIIIAFFSMLSSLAETHSNYKLTYSYTYIDLNSQTYKGKSWLNELWSPTDRVQKFSGYYYDFAQKFLGYCADCFGPQPEADAPSENFGFTTTNKTALYYRQLFGFKSLSDFEKESAIPWYEINNDLSTIQYVYYDKYSPDGVNIPYLVLANYEFKKTEFFGLNNSVFTGYDGKGCFRLRTNDNGDGLFNDDKFMCVADGYNDMGSIPRGVFSGMTDAKIYTSGTYRYKKDGVNKEKVAYIFFGPTIGAYSIDITTESGAQNLLTQFYRLNNTNAIGEAIRDISVVEGSVKSIAFKQWKYTYDGWSDDYNDASKFKEKFADTSYEAGDYYYRNNYSSCWRLAMELVVAKRFGYGENNIPKEKIVYESPDQMGIANNWVDPNDYDGKKTVLDVNPTLDSLYNFLKNDDRTNVAGWSKDFVDCAVFYMFNPQITTSDLTSIKECIFNEVIGYEDAAPLDVGYKQYDLIIDKILEKCLEECTFEYEYVYKPEQTRQYYYADAEVSEYFELNSNAPKEVVVKDYEVEPKDDTSQNDYLNPHVDNKHVDFYNNSTYFTQSMLLYSYFVNIEDFGVDKDGAFWDLDGTWDGGRVKVNGLSIGLTLPDNSLENDYERLSEYTVTLMTYFKHFADINGDDVDERIVERKFIQAKLTQDSDPNVYYAEFDLSDSGGFILHNQYVGWLNRLIEWVNHDKSRVYKKIKVPGEGTNVNYAIAAGEDYGGYDVAEYYTTTDTVSEWETKTYYDIYNTPHVEWVLVDHHYEVRNITEGYVPGYGVYYDGNGSMGECFIQLIITSPDADNPLNVVIDYLDVDYEN